MLSRLLRSLHARLLALPLVALLAPTPGATWSIVCVDTATGEICVATATCLEDLDIQTAVPVMRVGIGAAAAQAFVSAPNKVTIWTGFGAGDTPQQILDTLAGTDNFHQWRQYGIVSLSAPSVSFTGVNAQAAKGDLTGTAGTLRYSIQGNVLAGSAVLTAAETALISTPGDMGQKVMAAMEAARALGGDGRCSCNPFNPPACGAPPMTGQKTAHIGSVQLARIGDADGVCNTTIGCANGSYYLDLNVIGDAGDPDPVFTLQSMYDAWRAALAGKPDGITTGVQAGAQSLPADGLTGTTVTVVPRDVDGFPITTGGATVTVDTPDGSPTLASVGPVTSHPDGTYSFPLTAGTTTGVDTLRVRIDDGSVVATLYPYLSVGLDTPDTLHCGYDEVSGFAGASVPFTIDYGATFAGEPFILLASLSGTTPGVLLPGGLAPLNPDAITDYTLAFPGPPLLPGSSGSLDPQGRASASFVAPPGLLLAVLGLRLDWVTVTLGATPTPSNADGFDVGL